MIKIGILPLLKKSKNIFRFNLYKFILIHMIYKIIVKEKKNIMTCINVNSKILIEMSMKNIYLTMQLICYAAIKMIQIFIIKELVNQINTIKNIHILYIV